MKNYEIVEVNRRALENCELKPLDKFIYVCISAIGDRKECCAGNAEIAQYCGFSKEVVKKSISKMKVLGYIKQGKDESGTRILYLVK